MNKEEWKEWFMAVGFAGLIVVLTYALSWIITCGLIWVVCDCFDWTFTWSIATGVWVLFCIAKSIFSHHVTVKR